MFDELNYYQILEVSPDASFSAIRQAYQDVLSLYENDDVVADAFFSETEKAQIIDTINKAFDVLYDKHKRAAYDRYCFPEQPRPLWGTGHNEDPEAKKKEAANTPIPLFKKDRPLNPKECLTQIKATAQTEEATAMSATLKQKETITGRDIRSYRRLLGLTVDKVYEITRIASSTIRQIENDEFDNLPPVIYLKSFLTAYAEILHLSPETLVNGYMANMQTQSQCTE
ncbi:MAG: helix-turn-helix domain-containing protein [Thermodesulfobacteriota bacterium]|nr:helix-turn-helix domain-containing protein [Thermodesulfobacteriota bacterium]